MDSKNLFELWRENGEKLPFKAVSDSWSESSGHYVLIKSIKIKNWPYGYAIGQYFFYGKPGKIGVIANSGCYKWKIKEEFKITKLPLNKNEYGMYLHSEIWEQTKNKFKKNKCEKCGGTEMLNLHHLNYENIGNETKKDVITLCRKCHESLHFSSLINIKENPNSSELYSL